MLIRNPFYDELTEIISRLNNEFVVSKGMVLHIKDRFPGLFDKNNIENLFLLEDENIIRSFIAIKPVTLCTQQKTFRLFFVGAVFTDPQSRGKGYCSTLLKYIQEKYLDMHFDAGLLWTKFHNIYEKLGWQSYENGIFVEAQADSLKGKISEALNNCEIIELSPDYFQKIDEFRLSITDEYVTRKSNSGISGYGTVYSPGDKSVMYFALKDGAILGYLLGVQNKSAIIVYEIMGSFEIVHEIITRIYNNFSPDSVYLNIPDNNESYVLLNLLFGKYIVHKPNITMFLFRDENVFDELKNIYIPFTDRI